MMSIDEQLNDATFKNDLIGVKNALENGAEVSVDDIEPIKNAIDHNNLEILKILLDSIDKKNYIEIGSCTSHYAANINNYDALETLFEHGFSIHNCHEALTFALYAHDKEMSQYFIEKNIDLTYNNHYNYRCAVVSNNTQLIDLFLSRGISVDLGEGHLLMYSVVHNNLKLLDYAISKGANVSVGNDRALCHACDYEHIEVIHKLLDSGADYASQNYSPVRNAINNSNKELLELFLTYGLELEQIENCYSQTKSNEQIETWINTKKLVDKLEQGLTNQAKENKKYKI